MIRPARPEDIPALVALVKELAAYERAPDEVRLVAGDLRRALFGESPAAFAQVAEVRGEVVGMAVWFLTFSTWTGRHGIWLEDLVVRRDLRGQGYGRALLGALARLAVERGYARLEWAVLDWNEPAIGFYRHLGSAPQDEWTTHRVAGEALTRLAGSPE
ncbi:MAG: GNAT family N-acetyltransferase [Actinomycetota bacterium]